MDDANPYEAPRAVAADRRSWRGEGGRPSWRRLVGWVVVFVANLPVPVLFGLELTDRGGLAGMVVAMVAMATLGGIICVRWTRVGMALIIGGAAVAFSQVMPVLHVVAGVLGMEAGSVVGAVVPGRDDMGRAVGLAGGAIVTIVSGSLLIGTAAAIGLVLQVVTPNRWWGLAPGPSPLD